MAALHYSLEVSLGYAPHGPCDGGGPPPPLQNKLRTRQDAFLRASTHRHRHTGEENKGFPRATSRAAAAPAAPSRRLPVIMRQE